MSVIQKGNPPIFIQFAGQGMKYMDELRRLYTSYPNIQPFIQRAIAEIKKQASDYDDTETGFFDQGLEVDQWIEQPENAPDLAYLLSSPLSHPLIYLCQIANYISVLQEGVDQDKLLSNTHSTTGFSTGVVAALLVSNGLPLAELCDKAIQVQAMFFWQGVRCQQSMHQFNSNPLLQTELLNSNESSPSCMASINNIPKIKLDELIASFADYGIVHPAYELFPGRWIVAGIPENLAAFRAFLSEHLKVVEWKYVPSTIAAHCPFLRYALETSPVDADRIGLHFDSNALKIPVWSNDFGSDLREADNIIREVMRAYFTRPATWRKQISPLLSQSNIRYVLDFGPGTGVASLTENHISGSDIQVIRCAIPLGRKRLLEEVLAALD